MIKQKKVKGYMKNSTTLMSNENTTMDKQKSNLIMGADESFDSPMFSRDTPNPFTEQ
jgi:hypothetical protein